MRNMIINFIMHRLLKYLAQELATITVGMTAESVVTPTVIVAVSTHHALLLELIVIVNNLFRRKKKGHKWPKLKIMSGSKAENKELMAQICCP